MALTQIKESLTRSADRVHHAATRLWHGVDATFERHQLEGELDTLFAELGVEVYQRLRRGDPVEGSVVVQDLIDRIAQVEERLPALPGDRSV